MMLQWIAITLCLALPASVFGQHQQKKHVGPKTETSKVEIGDVESLLDSAPTAQRHQPVRPYARPNLLLEPKKLANPDLRRQYVILDARAKETYDKGHVPGARWVDHDAWKRAFGEGQDNDGWSKRIAELGIASDSRIVVLGDKGMKDAARIWWILKYWGVQRVQLLNGGWKGWQAAGLPVSQADTAAVPPSKLRAVGQAKRLATMAFVLDQLDGNRLQIVDARSKDEFCGIDKRDNKRGGAIPGAKQLEWSDLIDQNTHRFKSANELSRLFAQAGVDLARPTASHCNGGGRGAVMAFGLELMGAQDVRNYYRGWGEWGNAEEVPIEVPTPAEEASK